MKIMEKIRRHRHVFLIMVLFLAICGVIPAGMPDVAFATLQQDAEGYYQLSTKENIYEMADIISGTNYNKDNTSAGYSGNGHNGQAEPNAKFRMTGNIDMNNVYGNPTGPIWNNNNAYTGIFDGGGYTISNLYVQGPSYHNPDSRDVGLFRQTNGATIKDVTFADCIVNTNAGDYNNCGLVAGSMTNTNVDNVNINNSHVYIQGTGGSTNVSSNTGMLAGSINGGTVSNVTISGSTIDETSQYAQYAAQNAQVVKDINNVGMISGSINGTTLQNNTLSGNTVDLPHGNQNIGTATSVAGTATNVTVINPSQQSNPTSGNSDPEPTALPTEAPEPTLSPATTPEETTEPEPTIAPKPSATPLPKGTKFEEGENKYRALGGTKVGYAGTTEEGEAHVEIPDTVEDENGIEYRVTKILKNAFKGEETLKDITFGRYIEVVEEGAFKNCTALTRMETSSVLRIIEQAAFLNCEHLQNVKLPSTITSIGDKAFKNCKSMREFILGDESRETKAADQDTLDARLDQADGVGGGALSLALDEATFSSVISEDACHMQTDGEDADGKVVPAIDEDDLLGKLDTINISIGASVFSGCQNLRRVVINVQVTVIGNSAFANCTQLTDIEVYSKVLKTVGDSALKGVHDCKIAVVKVRLKKYKKLFQNRGQGKKVVVAKM